MLAAPFRCHAPLASVQVRSTAQLGRIQFLTNVLYAQLRERPIYAGLSDIREMQCELCINCFGDFDEACRVQNGIGLSKFYQFRQLVQK